MLEETCIRGRRARIPWACGHEAETRTQNLPALRGPDSRKCGAEPRGKRIGGPKCYGTASLNLVRFPPLLLAQSLPRKRFFGPALFAGFHVKAMLLDFLDDVFWLHLALERRSAFSRDSFSWMMTSATGLIHPQSGSDWFLAAPLADHAAAGCRLLRAPPLR